MKHGPIPAAVDNEWIGKGCGHRSRDENNRWTLENVR